MIYLIDTDIIIYSLKNHLTVKYNFRKHENEPKMISVITYGELIHGAKNPGIIIKTWHQYIEFQSCFLFWK